MKKERTSQKKANTEIKFNLAEQSMVELFLHSINQNRTIRIAHIIMHKGIRQLKIETNELQKGIYVYVLDANQQQLRFGRIRVE